MTLIDAEASGISTCTASDCIRDAGQALLQMRHARSLGHGEFGEAQDDPFGLALGHRPGLERSFSGASSVADEKPCMENKYMPSELENQWSQNVINWTDDHCTHMTEEVANLWINQNNNGGFDPKIFSTVCRKGAVPQFIEPIAGILRDPRAGCGEEWAKLMSVDWLVFPSREVLTLGAKARFYDAGASRFGEGLQFFLKTYRDHGIVFDEVYAWEYSEVGQESFWDGVEAETRAFWEPRVTFYDGIGVNAEKDSEHNPVSRIFKSCEPDDFCAFKLDIDTPGIELPLVQQILESNETRVKLDEFFFEHHVHGVMQRSWKEKVNGTFADSYKIFNKLRQIGVRAHSWV